MTDSTLILLRIQGNIRRIVSESRCENHDSSLRHSTHNRQFSNKYLARPIQMYGRVREIRRVILFAPTSISNRRTRKVVATTCSMLLINQLPTEKKFERSRL